MNSNETVTQTTSTFSGHGLPLISKPLASFSPEEFLSYCQAMKDGVPKGRKEKPIPIALGLTLKRTKTGAISITRAKSKRAFAYVTKFEIEALAVINSIPKSELWNAFKTKKFIIADNRMAAELIYAEINSIPWD